MTRESWELGGCSEIRKLWAFGRRNGPKSKKQEGFFQGGEYG